jgi:AAA domain
METRVTLAIKTITAHLPPLITVYGPEGVGKTTLGAQFPRPVFIQTENGCPAGLSLQSFGHLETYDAVHEALSFLAREPHDFGTLVFDSLDAFEPLIWHKACRTNGWSTIESPGFGRGYVTVDSYWLDFLAALNFLRRERGVIVVLIAHSIIEIINDPRTQSYTAYGLRLHKRARALIQDNSDVIGFLAPDLHITTEEQGFNKKRARADGGSTRWLHVEARPSFTAKNRCGMPAKITIPLNMDYGVTLAPYFPQPQRG